LTQEFGFKRPISHSGWLLQSVWNISTSDYMKSCGISIDFLPPANMAFPALLC
jgi:hypothetical protein